MRLIDADAFERDLTDNLLPLLIAKYGEEEARRGLHFSFNDLINNIQAQETVEPNKNECYLIKKMLSLGTNEIDLYIPIWCCTKCGKQYDRHFAKSMNYCCECGANVKGELYE